MKTLYKTIILILIINGAALAQNFLSQAFYNSYENYKDDLIKERRFGYQNLVKLIENLKSSPIFEVEIAGKSLNDRNIYLVKIGSGDIKVLAWSQMHGDEATATMALFDIFNFLKSDDDFNNFRKNLLKKVTLYFIPMLNPDGAEKFTRRNALNIDLNRDALRLQFPESQTLKKVRDLIKPDFGFNLHDQNTRYTAGNSFKTATLSFLAPAYNYQKDINSVRTNTMKLIVNLYDQLSEFIPGHIGRYSDDFEPRAFGDNFVKWGTSSVLIESGGWKNDEEKQFIRKLNFTALLTGFQSIADKIYEDADIEDYKKIPENEKFLFNLLFRNLQINYANKEYIVDIGINREEENLNGSNNFYIKSSIEDFGDLTTFYGNEEYDCTDMTIIEGKIFDKVFSSMNEIEQLDFKKLYEQGFTSVKLNTQKPDEKFTLLPINIIYDNADFETEIAPENPANFIIKKHGKVKYAIINGFVYDYETEKSNIKNALIFK